MNHLLFYQRGGDSQGFSECALNLKMKLRFGYIFSIARTFKTLINRRTKFPHFITLKQHSVFFYNAIYRARLKLPGDALTKQIISIQNISYIIDFSAKWDNNSIFCATRQIRIVCDFPQIVYASKRKLAEKPFSHIPKKMLL